MKSTSADHMTRPLLNCSGHLKYFLSGADVPVGSRRVPSVTAPVSAGCQSVELQAVGLIPGSSALESGRLWRGAEGTVESGGHQS